MVNHPQKARKLFKYMTVIRNIAKHNPISKWMQYDQQFRLCVSRNPLRSWSSIDASYGFVLFQLEMQAIV